MKQIAEPAVGHAEKSTQETLMRPLTKAPTGEAPWLTLTLPINCLCIRPLQN